jgi:murein DD-endopeptidase MepM/ murein hydrolase activator NlpD
MIRKLFYPLILMIFMLAACAPTSQPTMILPTLEQAVETPSIPDMTPFPTRPVYEPGELVAYTAQTGDTLDALAVRFNTSVEEIRRANESIPDGATTMPPGMPMQIPIYYRPLWGNPHQIIPDSIFINGPDAVGFDSAAYIQSIDGWLKDYSAWAFNGNRSAAEIIDYVAMQYAISPKLLIALLEYQGGACSQGGLDETLEQNILGLESSYWVGVYLQLSYAANILNDGYYRWREGDLLEFELLDGSLVRPDPWQNAATVAIQYFFSKMLNPQEFHYAIGQDWISKLFTELFGDPWITPPHIPGSLTQPEMQLPYTNDTTWAYTGGPHTAWGSMAPWAALDFAPPGEITGCYISSEPTVAVADGLIVRDGDGILVLDLDGDGEERTGWVVFYLHIATEGKIPVGTVVEAGDFLGYPSCEGGRSTGTHVHIARKFNGEWVTADGVIPFVLSGWRPIRGDEPYSGWLVKNDVMIIANTNPDNRSVIPPDVVEKSNP